MWRNNVFVTALCLSIIKCTLSVEFVPVYMWQTQKNVETVPALDRISEDSFKDLLLERLSKNPLVVIFAENNLSPEDFAQRDQHGKNLYPNLLKLKDEGKVTYWPLVRNPLLSIKQLDKKITEVNGESFVNDPFQVPENNILIVDLKDARDDEDRADMLKRHDDNVAKIYKRLTESHENVIALYTARHSSWVVPEESRSHRHYRSLLSVERADERTAFNVSNVLLFLNSNGTYHNNTLSVALTDMNVSSSVEQNNTLVKMIFNSPNQVSLEFGFLFDGGYWYLQYLNATESGKVYALRVHEVYAPENWSYHCTNEIFYGDDQSLYLSLPGLQVQPTLGDGFIFAFGDAYDCVGFTSAPIWSGLFVTFILALIMTFGLTMMMDIKTMDRFDDPKGKTITINVSE